MVYKMRCPMAEPKSAMAMSMVCLGSTVGCKDGFTSTNSICNIKHTSLVTGHYLAIITIGPTLNTNDGQQPLTEVRLLELARASHT